ncbi:MULTISPECIES: Fur family transcriptional regulator [unclassified Methylophilus]|uniref:Fur family transcriptional regulator n=1 Tax=unclassified Methylophilus TaxID=2630143 RepID=UPI0006FD56DA|nr:MULTISPECIES: transcriptional repressor [unclassified Methylophilus]KQT37239.1 Fur family transcriptional regulator [Methylophilus sp. Leaf416]KQT55591.1 Fur family transcriptional regulator [Methylophilus sp. Leaf459]
MLTAEQLITDAGLRPTKARVAVLNTLLTSTNALSHPDILAALQGVEIDRVTVYRVLDWLLENSLIHKISSDDRAWKFQLNAPKRNYRSADTAHLGLLNNHGHAHLHCQQCGTVLCIHELAAHIPQSLFDTYCVSNIEISLKGLCLDCQQS